MKEESDIALGVVIGIFIGMCFMGFGSIIFNSTYKDGFIDCKIGQEIYELVEHEDKTKTWEDSK